MRLSDLALTVTDLSGVAPNGYLARSQSGGGIIRGRIIVIAMACTHFTQDDLVELFQWKPGSQGRRGVTLSERVHMEKLISNQNEADLMLRMVRALEFNAAQFEKHVIGWEYLGPRNGKDRAVAKAYGPGEENFLLWKMTPTLSRCM